MIKSSENAWAVAYSEPCQTSKMERFAKIFNSLKPLTISAKRTILDIWQSSKYDTVNVVQISLDWQWNVIDIRYAIRGEERGRPALPFFDNQKKCPDFAKKGPDYVHP